MAMTISARSVEGHRERPAIKLLTIESVSLFKSGLKRLFKLQEKLFRIESVSSAKLYASASAEGQRDHRQDAGAHYDLRNTLMSPTSASAAAMIASL